MEILFLAFLWWLAGKGGGAAAPSPAGGGGTTITLPPEVLVSTPPWPQALPSGLPEFPGPRWTFDTPPPPEVQARARQLVDQLWRGGSGTHRVEQTAGRWIAYRAEIVASGKKGVVAYRLRSDAPIATAPKPKTTAARAPLPPAPRPVTTAPPSVLQLPTLRRGAGIRPQPPDPNVRILQQKLGIGADGQFGGGTERAVRAFQAKVGLVPNGIVEPKTWTALFAVRA